MVNARSTSSHLERHPLTPAGAPLRTPDTLQSAPAAHQREGDGSVAAHGSHAPGSRLCGAFQRRAGDDRHQCSGSAITARACVRTASASGSAFAIATNWSKVRPPMLRLYARIVAALPNARLLLQSRSFDRFNAFGQSRRIKQSEKRRQSFAVDQAEDFDVTLRGHTPPGDVKRPLCL